jgi:DNA repair protein RecN (Recombination protein N)
MLAELAIRDFAIIDELRIPFDDGLNALTGETGAGKSIIIDALGAVLGERIGSEVVRTGARSARVEAVFDLKASTPSGLAERCADLGLDLDDGTLILSRDIAQNGRSTGRINGTTVTMAVLGQIGARLIDIHGQSDHLKLLKTSEQLDALDSFAGVGDLRASVIELVRELSSLRSRRRQLRASERDREQRIDLLRYQVDEITAAMLEPGEDERLQQERNVLGNAERLVLDASAALNALESEDGNGAASLFRLASTSVADLVAIDTAAGGLAERTSEIVILAEELASDLRRYVDAIEANPARLAAVEERLDLITRLKRKYGATIDEVIAYGESASSELLQLTEGEQSDEALAAQVAELAEKLKPLLCELAERRTEAAGRLQGAINGAISELGMGSATVQIAISQEPEPTETGLDRIEFLFSPNAGESPKPLARIASGGETARLMLALKSVLAADDETPTLVFDEVDVGVGARSGQVVGEKLWSLSGRHQVIVISHLAQIAAFAGTHFMIEKDVVEGRTVSSVNRLEGGRRFDELAEMIDGKPVSPESRAAAEQLVERIERLKRTAW